MGRKNNVVNLTVANGTALGELTDLGTVDLAIPGHILDGAKITIWIMSLGQILSAIDLLHDFRGQSADFPGFTGTPIAAGSWFKESLLAIDVPAGGLTLRLTAGATAPTSTIVGVAVIEDA